MTSSVSDEISDLAGVNRRERERRFWRNLVSLLAHLPEHLRRRTSAGYNPEIDGLRFFAITIVVLGHAAERLERMYTGPRSEVDRFAISFFSAPGSGVLLFFAISGFIITSQFLKRPVAPLSPAYLKTYFKRRLLRIEPPYMLVLLATYIGLQITKFVPSGVHGFWLAPKSLTTSLWSSLVYSHGWWFGTNPRLFPAGWSLEIEVQFYVLAPLLFFGYFALREVRTRAGLGAFLLILFAFAVQYIPDESRLPYGGTPHLYFTILRFFPYFAIGVMLADLQPIVRAHQLPTWFISTIGIVGLGALWSSSIMQAVQWLPSPIILLVKLLGIGAMFLGAFTEQSSFCSFCAGRWTSFIGGACYSIYLTHLSPIQFATSAIIQKVHCHSFVLELIVALLIEVPIVLGVALLFYSLVERTFMIRNWPQLAWEWLAKATLLRGGAVVIKEPAVRP